MSGVTTVPAPEDHEASVVFTSRWVLVRYPDGEEYLEVVETMHTPFHGEGARRRAEGFCESERERGDFPESDGWVWFVKSNQAANEAYGEWFTNQLLGEEASSDS